MPLSVFLNLQKSVIAQLTGNKMQTLGKILRYVSELNTFLFESNSVLEAINRDRANTKRRNLSQKSTNVKFLYQESNSLQRTKDYLFFAFLNQGFLDLGSQVT